MDDLDPGSRCVLWLRQHRQELQRQLDILSGGNINPLALKIEVISDTAVAREIVAHWIDEIDELLSRADRSNASLTTSP